MHNRFFIECYQDTSSSRRRHMSFTPPTVRGLYSRAAIHSAPSVRSRQRAMVATAQFDTAAIVATVDEQSA